MLHPKHLALPTVAVGLALLSSGFSRVPQKTAPPQLGEVAYQPAMWHSRHGCYDWGRSGRRTPAGLAHLNYYGGKVVSNAKIVMVLYGTGTYGSFLTSTTTPNMASFYSQVTSSIYMDWLTEYNTPTQTIGRGTYLGKYSISPAASRNKASITDTQIQTEIGAQISTGHLPVSDSNTIYTIHFPKGKTISQGGSRSCVSGGFCAYHGTFNSGGKEIYYGVFPDMSPGTGCATGCGGSTQFNNQCSVASHEMIETVTDAEVGLATVVGPPLAWYDPANGEIGDICNGVQGTFVGTDGSIYTVQKEWSNAVGACIVHK